MIVSTVQLKKSLWKKYNKNLKTKRKSLLFWGASVKVKKFDSSPSLLNANAFNILFCLYLQNKSVVLRRLRSSFFSKVLGVFKSRSFGK